MCCAEDKQTLWLVSCTNLLTEIIFWTMVGRLLVNTGGGGRRRLLVIWGDLAYAKSTGCNSIDLSTHIQLLLTTVLALMRPMYSTSQTFCKSLSRAFSLQQPVIHGVQALCWDCQLIINSSKNNLLTIVWVLHACSLSYKFFLFSRLCGSCYCYK